MVEPRWEVKIGSPVTVTDGDYGRLQQLLVEVSGAEVALYRSFEPVDFVSPPAGWQPPYPYRWEQVLFDRERLEEL